MDNTQYYFLLADEFEYTFDIYSAPIFPDDKLKNYILTEHNQEVYNISHLSFGIMDHTINALDVQNMSNRQYSMIQGPDLISKSTLLQRTLQVNGWEKADNKLEIKSLYGIYDSLAR